MKITFKDVGQGDSIIIEWQNNGVNKIGIIDCNLKGRLNPVLRHLKNGNYAEIEFIVLSHPHRDHYSGLLQLFNYINSSGIALNIFMHTLKSAGAEYYWKYFEVNNSDSRKLKKIISLSRVLKEKGLIRRIKSVGENFSIDFDDSVSLSSFAPTHDSVLKYQSIVEREPDKNIKEASQAANYLSTLFKLTANGKEILLTSDSENSVFEELLEHEKERFVGTQFDICQLPHHGSLLNFFQPFWQIVEGQVEKHAIISAGKHCHYNHPSYEVVKGFHDQGYLVHCTNIVNGMEEFTNYLSTINRRSLILGTGGDLQEEYLKSNDRVFTLQEDKFIVE